MSVDPLTWGRGDRRRVSTRDIPAGVLALVDARLGARACSACVDLGLELPPEVPLEIDHKQPLAAGGDNHHLNLRWLCRSHNRGRGKRKGLSRDPAWKRRTDRGLPA